MVKEVKSNTLERRDQCKENTKDMPRRMLPIKTMIKHAIRKLSSVQYLVANKFVIQC